MYFKTKQEMDTQDSSVARFEESELLVQKIKENLKSIINIDTAVRFIVDSNQGNSVSSILTIPIKLDRDVVYYNIATVLYDSLIAYYLNANPKSSHYGLSSLALEGEQTSFLSRETEKLIHLAGQRNDIAGCLVKGVEFTIVEPDIPPKSTFFHKTLVSGLDLHLGLDISISGATHNYDRIFIPVQTGGLIIEKIYQNLETLIQQSLVTYDEIHDEFLKVTESLIFTELEAVLRRLQYKINTRRKLLVDIKSNAIYQGNIKDSERFNLAPSEANNSSQYLTESHDTGIKEMDIVGNEIGIVPDNKKKQRADRSMRSYGSFLENVKKVSKMEQSSTKGTDQVSPKKVMVYGAPESASPQNFTNQTSNLKGVAEKSFKTSDENSRSVGYRDFSESETGIDYSAVSKKSRPTRTGTGINRSSVKKKFKSTRTETNIDHSTASKKSRSTRSGTGIDRSSINKNPNSTRTETNIDRSSVNKNPNSTRTETNIDRSSVNKNPNSTRTETNIDRSTVSKKSNSKSLTPPTKRRLSESYAQREPSLLDHENISQNLSDSLNARQDKVVERKDNDTHTFSATQNIKDRSVSEKKSDDVQNVGFDLDIERGSLPIENTQKDDMSDVASKHSLVRKTNSNNRTLKQNLKTNKEPRLSISEEDSRQFRGYPETKEKAVSNENISRNEELKKEINQRNNIDQQNTAAKTGSEKDIFKISADSESVSQKSKQSKSNTNLASSYATHPLPEPVDNSDEHKKQNILNHSVHGSSRPVKTNTFQTKKTNLASDDKLLPSEKPERSFADNPLANMRDSVSDLPPKTIKTTKRTFEKNSVHLDQRSTDNKPKQQLPINSIIKESHQDIQKRPVQSQTPQKKRQSKKNESTHSVISADRKLGSQFLTSVDQIEAEEPGVLKSPEISPRSYAINGGKNSVGGGSLEKPGIERPKMTAEEEKASKKISEMLGSKSSNELKSEKKVGKDFRFYYGMEDFILPDVKANEPGGPRNRPTRLLIVGKNNYCGGDEYCAAKRILESQCNSLWSVAGSRGMDLTCVMTMMKIQLDALNNFLGIKRLSQKKVSMRVEDTEDIVKTIRKEVYRNTKNKEKPYSRENIFHFVSNLLIEKLYANKEVSKYFYGLTADFAETKMIQDFDPVIVEKLKNVLVNSYALLLKAEEQK